MSNQILNKRVAVFFAEGFEEIEGLSVINLLWRAQIPCDKVSISGDTLVASSHGVSIVCDCSIEDEDFAFENYDMLVLPGGLPGTTNLRACEPLCQQLQAFAEAEQPIAAICAAPSVFAELGLLKGRRATSHPGFQHVLSEQGALLDTESAVVVDGTIITSQGMGCALEFGFAIVRYYLGEEAVETIKSSIVYQG